VAYLEELQKRKHFGDNNLTITELSPKKIGRLLLLDEQTDKEVQIHIFSLREAGGGANCAIAKASATGIIK